MGVMGVLWGAGVLLLGMSFPLVGVAVGAAWGTLFGEWKNSGKTAKAAMTSGVFCLMTAIIILGKAGH